jgi:Uma2 family endonuclease
MQIQEKLYTLDEFWEIVARPENADKRLELIDGVIYEMTPSFIPSHIAIQIASALNAFVKAHDLGYVTGADGGYTMTEGNMFIPDVAFILKERLPEFPDRHVPIPPDFAVEVVSPTDEYPDAHRKAMRYLQNGAQLVWVVYPTEKKVHVYTPSGQNSANVTEIDINGTLDGGTLLPGFSLPVKDIFPQA